LDNFVLEFRKLFRFVNYHGNYTPSSLLNWIGREFLDKVYTTLPPKYKEKVDQGVSRSLTYFSDGLGKVRYIAISDWLTQATLSPLASSMLSILKKLRTDYTYDQEKIIPTAQTWFAEGKKS